MRNDFKLNLLQYKHAGIVKTKKQPNPSVLFLYFTVLKFIHHIMTDLEIDTVV